ncbi:contractile injection system sheath initiator [Paenibacillus tyrfis]|uniref:Uncharacterized protein n=1 Tax=Paenibacillus tyrfis TaxID=1501230 RepID=A0A081NWR0_9BACL|nr:DUF2634 domain-containing protein [Paenibacillus tyrfis]KEQ22883.1 hypothetical protein ET33_21300 [Paenibacillus tyrfis]
MQSPKLINGDLVFENYELVMVEEVEELAQCCEIVLGTNRGEWFLNPSMGIDFKKVTGKHISLEAAKQQIREGLRQESRISSVDEIIVRPDDKRRTCDVSFVAYSTDGERINMGVIPGVG